MEILISIPAPARSPKAASRRLAFFSSHHQGSANKILRHLADLALLGREKKGRMVFYRLNAGNPFVKQLKVLGNLWTLGEFVEENKEKAKRIILFGSCAEGTDVRESDIDVFILADEKKTVKESAIILDAGEFAKMKREDKPLYERIDRGVVLWERV